MSNINPNTTQNNESIEFVEPKNPLDPIVVFDPEFEFSNIIMPLTDYGEGVPNAQDNGVNTLAIDGIDVPLLKVNNKVIFAQQIYSIIISIKSFLPEIQVTLNDPDKNIQGTDVPGMNNIITVIMTAPVDGANKKISLDFYITDCIFNGDNTVTYKGEFNANGIKQVKYEQIGDSQLTTYEMLEKIAKELKLGFACTEKCKDISDKRWRQIRSKTYKDFILQELTNGGVDENSIFDAWIDNFGYLVMVNIPYIMKEEINYKQLTTKVITGNTMSLPEGTMPEQNVEEVYRIITNSEEGKNDNNLYVSDYKSIVNNNNIMNKGTLNRYYYLSSPCEQNLISQEQIQIIEDSIDGQEGMDEYTYENIEFLGTNQTDDEDGVCTLVQEQIVTNYLNKIYAKMLKVTLPKANHSLQRGMLVTLMIEEYTPKNKQAIANNGDNVLAASESEETVADVESGESREILIDERNGVINPGLTGIYYIKEIEINYNAGLQQVGQILTLIKKGVQSNINNKYTISKSVDV